MEIKLFCALKLFLHFAFAANSWNAEFICLLLWCRCVCHRVQQNIKKIADEACRRWRSLFRCL